MRSWQQGAAAGALAAGRGRSTGALPGLAPRKRGTRSKIAAARAPEGCLFDVFVRPSGARAPASHARRMNSGRRTCLREAFFTGRWRLPLREPAASDEEMSAPYQQEKVTNRELRGDARTVETFPPAGTGRARRWRRNRRLAAGTGLAARRLESIGTLRPRAAGTLPVACLLAASGV